MTHWGIFRAYQRFTVSPAVTQFSKMCLFSDSGAKMLIIKIPSEFRQRFQDNCQQPCTIKMQRLTEVEVHGNFRYPFLVTRTKIESEVQTGTTIVPIIVTCI